MNPSRDITSFGGSKIRITATTYKIRISGTPNNSHIPMRVIGLVGREAVEKDFEVAIFEAARGFDNNFTFDFNGPWAPHNFVDVELRF